MLPVEVLTVVEPVDVVLTVTDDVVIVVAVVAMHESHNTGHAMR